MKKLTLLGVEGLEVPKTPLLRVGEQGGLFVCGSGGGEIISCTEDDDIELFAAVAVAVWDKAAARSRAEREDLAVHGHAQACKWQTVFDRATEKR